VHVAKLNTVREFVSAVDDLVDIEDAYYVFEDACSESLRSDIYTMADSDSPEPFRSAMHALGYNSY
jgi:hypothetical protein